jgi:alkylhydroperoxidase/carboxymuconolactone decarboxylase family protein YurZ
MTDDEMAEPGEGLPRSEGMEQGKGPDREAWVALASEEEVRASLPPGVRYHYDFGFVPGMARLISAHPTIGPALRGLFREVMFAPGALTRAEREMVAAVASAAQRCEY